MCFRKNDLQGNLLYGSVLIDLIHDFLHERNGERLIALPSLSFNSPGFFDNYKPFGEEEDDDEVSDDPEDLDEPNSLKLSLVYRGDKIRILTDVLNISDWRIFWDFLQYPEIEIRHVQDLNMYFFVHLGRKWAFNIMKPYACDYAPDFEEDALGFETFSDYKEFQDLFEKYWEDAEPITCEKIEHMYELAGCDEDDCFEKELLKHTYFLFPSRKKLDEDECYTTVRSAFSSEVKYIDGSCLSLAYFVGIKIPKDAEQVIVCTINEKTNCIEYEQAFRVFGNDPIRKKDDVLEWHYPERGFSIIQSFDRNESIKSTYLSRPKCYYSRNIYMARKVFGFECDSKMTQKFQKILTKKFRTDAAFRDAVKETYFLKWADVMKC
jgi:hypothetical protein